MASPTAAEFKTFFSQYAATADAAIEVWLNQFPLRFTPGAFNAQASMASYLYTAHQLTIFDPDRANSTGDHEIRGAIMSEKVLDQSRGYGATFDIAGVPKSLRWLTGTTYGQQLIGIILSRSASRGSVILTGSSLAPVGTSVT